MPLTWAMISDPIPHCGQPVSTDTRWFVFLTDLIIASVSSGRSVRKLTTSQLIPCWLLSCSAASSETPTPYPNEIIETSSPSSSILAWKYSLYLGVLWKMTYLADWADVVFVKDFIGHFKSTTVQDFILQENNWIWITNGGLQHTLAVFGWIWCHDDETFEKKKLRKHFQKWKKA